MRLLLLVKVGLHMFCHSSFDGEWYSTNSTHKRFLAPVYAEMVLQRALGSKALATNITLEGSFTRVVLDVAGHIVLEGKTHATNVTLEWLVGIVGPDVPGQFDFSREEGVTNGACVNHWLLMQDHVLCKSLLLGEEFLTNWASMLLRLLVGNHVLCKCFLLHKSFPTDDALILRRQDPLLWGSCYGFHGYSQRLVSCRGCYWKGHRLYRG